MPTPNAIGASIKFRRQLLKQEAASAERMGRIYSRIYTGLLADVEKLADDIAAMDKPTKGKITKLARMRAILAQVSEQAARFGSTVEDEISDIQSLAIQQGVDDALKLMELSLPDLNNAVRKGVVGSFLRLPADAVEFAAGLFGDDSPLRQRLKDSFGEFVSLQVADHITDGIAVGQNPRKIARLLNRNLQNSLGTGLKSTLTTVRTAQIKAYQLANHATYSANPRIVPHWIWHANIGDPRTCLSCIAQHGTRHPVTETLNDHHNGRCAPLPAPISYADLGLSIPDPVPRFETGKEWFARQSKTQQRKIMGDSRFEAFEAGKFQFEDLSQGYNDPVYGELLRESSLKRLLKKRGRQRFTGGTPSEQLAELSIEQRPNDFTPKFFQFKNELEWTKENGEFYEGELQDIQDGLDAEWTISNVASSRGKKPASMTETQWESLADELKEEAAKHLEVATLPGRQAAANRAVGRHFIGGKKQEFIQVGGKTVEKKWAGGSAKKASQAIKKINAETRADAIDYMGGKLTEYGYPEQVVGKLGYTQRRRLLAEIGNNQLLPANITGVKRQLREEVLANSTPKTRMESLSIAYNPRAGVGLEKWTHYEMAMVKAGKEQLIEYPPDVHESSIPDFVLLPNNKRPTVEFAIEEPEEIPF